MISHRAVRMSVAILFFCLLFSAQGYAYVINFDNLTNNCSPSSYDYTAVTDQYSSLGVTFANATLLTAGICLNEIDFPPVSGSNVVFDDGGPMTINFSTLVTNAGGYFTYGTSLTLEAFDILNSPIGTVTSSASSNFGSNELIHIAFADGISQLVITGDIAGGSFTLDDFTATPVTGVPEPSMLLLLGGGLMGLAGFRYFRK
jgi:hypothetical protein